MKKWLCLALALWLCLVSSGFSQGTYPARQGYVTDLAGVIGEQTEKDFAAYAQRLEAETGYRLHLVSRHFLGGKEIAAYGRGLFEAWGLQERDGLLLMVVGEEKYALICGEKLENALPKEVITALMGDSFRPAFLNREYDKAAGDTALALGDALARKMGKTIASSGLFGAPAAQEKTSWTQEAEAFWRGLFGEDEEEEDRREKEEQKEETKSNFRTLLTWSLVIYFLFIRKRIRKKRRK